MSNFGYMGYQINLPSILPREGHAGTLCTDTWNSSIQLHKVNEHVVFGRICS